MNTQMENENAKTIKVEIPTGYMIDSDKSNFLTGDLVLKCKVVGIEKVIDQWDKDNAPSRSFGRVGKFLRDNAPADCYVRYLMIVIGHYFDEVLKYKLYRSNSLTVGRYVIDRESNRCVDADDLQGKHKFPKGAIEFKSLEEATFVKEMMDTYYNFQTWNIL